MVDVARKTLLSQRLRFAMTAAGVSLAVMLILLLSGMYVGINRQITAYIDNQPADIVVAQEGVRDFLGSRSSLPKDVADRVRRTGGVAAVVPVISQYAVVDVGSRKEFSLIVGYDSAVGGGPWEMVSGNARLSSDEVVADDAVGRARGLRLGSGLEILGKKFRVAGFSGGTSSWMTGMFFMTFDSASEVVAAGGRPSFLLVRTAPGLDPANVARRVEQRIRGVSAVTRQEVDDNDRRLYARVLDGPMGFMVAVALLVGTAVVALSIYTATAERAREYGALKAIGISNARLYRIVFEQALISVIVGCAAGILLAYVLAAVIPLLNPRFMVIVEPTALLGLLAVALLMALLASFVPARAVAAIDPAIAFRRGA